MLSDTDSKSPDWIAARLGVSEDVVKLGVHEARLALRTMLDPHMRAV